MGDDKNDYDRAADGIGEVIANLLGLTCYADADEAYALIPKDVFLTALIQLQRQRDWLEGLASVCRERATASEGAQR